MRIFADNFQILRCNIVKLTNMKKPFLMLAAMTLGMVAQAQQTDPVVMRVNGKDVTRSEFEYSYNKNNTEQTLDKKTLDEYVQLFVDFKLKVAAAEDMKLDTMTSFINEFKGYRDQQAQEYLIDTAFIEAEARRTYDATVANIGPGGLVRTAHILLRIPQQADEATQQAVKARMDSIYAELQNGRSFADLATELSEDPGSARAGGELPWIFAKQVFPEYAKVAYSLEVGQLSEPFYSPAGIHVMKLLEKKQFEPYEFHRKDIHTFLERRGIRQQAMEAKADLLYKQYEGRIPRDKVLAYEDSLLESRYPEFRLLMQEYHDGLLLFEASNQCVWQKASSDEEGLQRFFKKNKKKYAWDSPRFKGAVVHCATPELAAQVKKAMKKMPEAQWRNYLRTDINQDSLQLAFMERGLFKQGINANVDHYIFKQGEPRPRENMPYTVIIGKLQKKYPGSYMDVRGPVTADYQLEMERNWVKSLREKYPVEIFPEVLKTVNKQ